MVRRSQESVDPFEDARRAIEDPRFSVIGFDVFDTLLVRPALEPGDLFRLVGLRAAAEGLLDDFAGMRVAAEAATRARLRASAPDREEPDLAAVHATLAELAGLPRAAGERLLALECEVERRAARAREPMRGLYETARRLGKRIVVVSDACADAGLVADLLAGAGLSPPDHLYVSSAVGLTKSSGRLYRHILDDLRLDPTAWFHVGDNPKSDVTRAREAGLTALRVPRAGELYFARRGALDLWAGDDVVIDDDHRLLLGLSVARHFDRLDGGDDPEAWGHLLLGPLLVAAEIEPPAEGSPLARLAAAAVTGEDLDPVRRALLRGAGRAAAEARATFSAEIDRFRLDVGRLAVPLARARAGLVAGVGPGWFEDPLFAALAREAAPSRLAPLSALRRAELWVLDGRLTANRRQRLITDAPRFFREARQRWLRPYARLRPLLTGRA